MKAFLPAALAACAALCAAAPTDASAQALRAGAAASNITPPLGTTIVGGFAPYPATHVHDELHARCLVVDDGKTTLALVICDVLGLNANVSIEARRLVEKATGIPPENVLVAATHTHSAGSALGEKRYEYLAELNDYQKFLAGRIADGVKRAHNLLRPAEVAFGSVEVPEHVHNRRWIMKDGTAPVNPFGKIDKAKMNPPRASENLVEPAGPTDPTVSFVAFREPGGRLISLLAAYSLHYVGGVKGPAVSADYFAVFSEHLKSLVDGPPTPAEPPFVAMMANGTSGDINNNNYAVPGEKRAPYEQMTYVGEDVANKVHGALGGLEWKAEAALDARYVEIELRRKPFSDELRAWAKETLDKTGRLPGKVDLANIYAQRIETMAALAPEVKVPLQHLRIGDIGIGTFPTETFAETGLEFKERSPLKHPFMIELAHGYMGYLPTPRHFELGGYETWPGTNHLEPQASVKMLDALLGLAKESLGE